MITPCNQVQLPNLRPITRLIGPTICGISRICLPININERNNKASASARNKLWRNERIGAGGVGGGGLPKAPLAEHCPPFHFKKNPQAQRTKNIRIKCLN